MTKTLVRRSHFFEPLERLFDRTTNDWFVGLDKMIDEMSAKWDKAIEDFRELPRSTVEKVDEGHYRVTVDVTGFSREELTVSLVADELRVHGEHKEEIEKEEEKSSKRSTFHQSFLIAEGMKVDSVKLVDHDLVIELTVPVKPEPEVTHFDIG